jgi:ubiquinone/menaquinone biosynthesis C-methylase UbiE
MFKKGKRDLQRALRDHKHNATDWGGVAHWYDKHLEDKDSYHAQVVAPNLDRIVALRQGETLLELGCGQGFFLEKFSARTNPANLFGVDLGKELIALATQKNHNINYVVASADDATLLPNRTFDVITIVLALQNMRDMNAVIANAARLLNAKGRLYIVLNHPAFRIPKQSDWAFDQKTKTQTRVMKKYLSEEEIAIDMNPGSTHNKAITTSFHRPLQVYSKAFHKHGFAITKIEEWISHKKSEAGVRAEAEDYARKEFPLFMCLELKKVQ